MVVASLVVVPIAGAQTFVPYGVDDNTLHLYHFDESAGELPAGTPFSDAVGTLHLINTGGLTGRDASTANGNGYGGITYANNSSFGSSFDVLRSGDTTFHTGLSGSGTGGGAATASGVSQASLQGAGGAFTLEALVNSTVDLTNSANGLSHQRTILSHDGDGNSRGFQLRVLNKQLSFYTGSGSLTAAVPTTGEHAFAANKWFHVAVTYDGIANTAGNLKFYWTALDAGPGEANLVATATLSADLVDFNNNLAVGTIGRSPYRFEWQGFIDEVRVSNVARGADEFLTVPEPASMGLLLTGAGLLLGRRRRGA